MKMLKRGQGATEYLLMLAAVLIIVAIAVYYVTSSGGGPVLSYTAENASDNVIVTFGTGTASVTSDWEWCIVSGGTAGSWNTSSTDIGPGVTIPLVATADGSDVFRIRIGSSVYNATVV